MSEIVASMTRQPRRDMQVQMHKGAASRRFDHYQVTVPDVAKAALFYASLGFRIAEYMTVGDQPVGESRREVSLELIRGHRSPPRVRFQCVQRLRLTRAVADILPPRGL